MMRDWSSLMDTLETERHIAGLCTAALGRTVHGELRAQLLMCHQEAVDAAGRLLEVMCREGGLQPLPLSPQQQQALAGRFRRPR